MGALWISGCKVALSGGESCPVDQIMVIQTNDALLSGVSALSSLNAYDVAQVFSASFGAVVLFYLLGRGVGVVLRLIRNG